MDKLNEKASLSMSLTGFSYEFWSKFMFFSGFGYLSVYVFGSKFLFFSGIGFRQIVREIYDWRFFEVAARASGALEVSIVVWSNIGLYYIRILLLNWCWCMVKKDHRNITISSSQNLTLNWCWCMVKKDHKNITISLSQNLILNWCWCMVKKDQQLMWCCTMFTWRNHVCMVAKDQKLVLSFALKKCEGDVVYGLEWWQGILIIY